MNTNYEKAYSFIQMGALVALQFIPAFKFLSTVMNQGRGDCRLDYPGLQPV
jgi:hypothetical protein